MNPADKKAKYSRQWGENVVQALKNKHTRATELVCEILEIEEKHLVTYLIYGDPLWNSLRDLIKRAEIALEIHAGPSGYAEVNRFFTEHLPTFTGLPLRDRLTARISELKLREQGSRGGRGGLPAESSRPSSSSSDLPGQLYWRFDVHAEKDLGYEIGVVQTGEA